MCQLKLLTITTHANACCASKLLLTAASTTMFCSLAQITPLSKVLLMRMELTAMGMSADASITAGVLPAPTPMEGWPDS
jgi:hypothetical protein